MWSDLNKFAYKDKHTPEKTPLFLVYEINGADGHQEKIVHLKAGIAKENYGKGVENLLLGYQQVRTYCDKTYKTSNFNSKYEFIIPEGYSGC